MNNMITNNKDTIEQKWWDSIINHAELCIKYNIHPVASCYSISFDDIQKIYHSEHRSQPLKNEQSRMNKSEGYTKYQKGNIGCDIYERGAYEAGWDDGVQTIQSAIIPNEEIRQKLCVVISSNKSGNEKLQSILELFTQYRSNEWIKVEDGLPVVSQKDPYFKKNYISDNVAVLENRRECIAKYNHEYKIWMVEGRPYQVNVTHWMPLPHSPKK